MSHTHVLAVDLDTFEERWVLVNRPDVPLPELPVRNYNEPKTAPNLLGDWSLEPLIEPESYEPPTEVETPALPAVAAQERAKPVWLMVWLGVCLGVIVTGGYLAQKWYNQVTFGN